MVSRILLGEESVTNIFSDEKISRPRLTVFALFRQLAEQTQTVFRLSIPYSRQAVGLLRGKIAFVNLCARRESNPRPSGSKPGTLSTELRARYSLFIAHMRAEVKGRDSLYGILDRYNFLQKTMGKLMALLGILVIGGALVVWKFTGKSETEKMGADTKGTTGTDMKASEKKVNARVSYKNPAGDDEVAFTLTVNGEGIIVSASAEVLAIHDISKKRQEAFAGGLATALSGKKLSDLASIDRVGGSSLTTGAFNQALPQLKSQL